MIRLPAAAIGCGLLIAAVALGGCLLGDLRHDFDFDQAPRRPLVLDPGVAQLPGPSPIGRPQLAPVPTGP